MDINVSPPDRTATRARDGRKKYPVAIALGVLLLAWQSPSAAGVAFTSNPSPAYPPGCISVPLQQLDLQAANVAHFHSQRVNLEVAYRIPGEVTLGEAQFDLYRVGCAEPNRSVVIAEFRLPQEAVDARRAQLILPTVEAVVESHAFPLVFKSEANTWGQPMSQYVLTRESFGDYTGGWDDPRRFTWRYVLDVSPAWTDRDSAPKYYNSEFGLQFYWSDGKPLNWVLVPATAAVLGRAASLPLGGRLSGHWVEGGSADQGLILSFNALVTGGLVEQKTMDLLVFLSWFTFDADGEMLWLTGAARFEHGADQVSIPIELVEGGTFLGANRAQRGTVGSVQLKAFHCNRLELDYQLDNLGLGAGVMRLERPFALEIADYACRDYEGLQSSIYPPESN